MLVTLRRFSTLTPWRSVDCVHLELFLVMVRQLLHHEANLRAERRQNVDQESDEYWIYHSFSALYIYSK